MSRKPWSSLLPALKTVVANTTDLQGAVNASVDMGTNGLLIHIADLGDRRDYAPLEAFVFEGRKNDAGAWTVAPESLLSPVSSYTHGDVWVSGDAAEAPAVTLSWGFGLERPLRFELHRPILSMQLAGDHEAAVRGVIAGILSAETISAEGTEFVRAINSDFCNDEDTARNVILGAADILLEGRQDPDLLCDGISFGIGFDAVAIPDVEAIAPPEDVAVPCLGGPD